MPARLVPGRKDLDHRHDAVAARVPDYEGSLGTCVEIPGYRRAVSLRRRRCTQEPRVARAASAPWGAITDRFPTPKGVAQVQPCTTPFGVQGQGRRLTQGALAARATLGS